MANEKYPNPPNPIQSIEIIEIDSEDEVPHSNSNNQNGVDDDDEVQFVSETPAEPGNSWESGSYQSSLDSLILRYFTAQSDYLHNTELLASPSRIQSERLRRSPSRTILTREARQNSGSASGTSARATAGSTTGGSSRRTLRDRIQSSGIWGTPGTTAGSTIASATAATMRRRLSNQLEEAAHASSYLRNYLDMYSLIRGRDDNDLDFEDDDDDDTYHDDGRYHDPYHNRYHDTYHGRFPHPYRVSPRHRPSHPTWLNAFGIPFSMFGTPEADEDAMDMGQNAMDAEPDVPEIKPIVPARLGYTKTISQDVIIACPGCKNEFGHDNQSVKLWVIVGCGHVICHNCSESLFRSKVINKKKAKSKNKGKAKWTAHPDTEEESNPHGEEEVNGAKVVTMEEDFKIVTKSKGSCPTCSRNIKKTSIQQLFL
ncbi:hypothetical protein BGZ46_007864 [Entomortierella lignicola]|nr:hypothetical protein BGZ46_007864 [Entomortierella lignicola]